MRVNKIFTLLGVALLGMTASTITAVADEVDVSSECAADPTSDACKGEAGEEYQFEAEVSRLMDIIINSLYQNKDIFLRELISNSADALDKVRFLSLSDPEILTDNEELEIKISFDKENNVLTIRDSGIGMTKEDLISNLGTIARSGTTNFVEQLAASGENVNLIGQFGVGFYSVYLVADSVDVVSRRAGNDQYIWTSSADSKFTVTKDPAGNSLGRGTEIRLHLKEDATEYLDEGRLEEMVKHHSEFIQFPIYLYKTKTEQVPVEDDEEENTDLSEGEEDDDEADDDDDEDENDDEDLSVEDEEGDSSEEMPKMETVTTQSWEQVNSLKAIWTRSKSEITKDEYNDFYKSAAKDYQDPLTYVHFSAEGEVEFKSILYIPGKLPYGHFDNYYSKSSSLKLYVRKVLVSDSFEDLIPKYLSFVKGVVDSDDIPINVSRETLQEHKVLKVIGKKLVRKVLEMLRKMADREKENAEDEDEEDDEEEEEDEEEQPKYQDFYDNFGKAIKLGVMEDHANKNKLIKLLRFYTTNSDGVENVSLETYVSRMKESQKNIYYISGPDLETIKKSAFLERAIAKDIEVILLVDPIDEYCMNGVTDFEGKSLKNLAKGTGADFGDSEDDKKRFKLYKKKYAPLTKYLKELFGDQVEKVVVSKKLKTSPAVLVTGEFGNSAHMEKIVRAQTFGDSKKGHMKSKKTLEINPRHPIVNSMLDNIGEELDEDLAWLLFDTALLNSGFEMEDPSSFAERMYRLMSSGLSLESSDLLEEIEIPEEEEEEEEEEAAGSGDEPNVEFVEQ